MILTVLIDYKYASDLDGGEVFGIRAKILYIYPTMHQVRTTCPQEIGSARLPIYLSSNDMKIYNHIIDEKKTRLGEGLPDTITNSVIQSLIDSLPSPQWIKDMLFVSQLMIFKV